MSAFTESVVEQAALPPASHCESGGGTPPAQPALSRACSEPVERSKSRRDANAARACASPLALAPVALRAGRRGG